MNGQKELKFPSPNRQSAMEKIERIRPFGKQTSSKNAYSCRVCRRRTGPVLWLLEPGKFLCDNPNCKLVSVSEVGKCFPTPYGPAVHVEMLTVFTPAMDFGARTVVEWAPIDKRKKELVEAWVDLIEWQKAYDLYERLNDPEGYKMGKISIIPPRRLDDVLALRSIEPLVAIDPTDKLPATIQKKIRALRERGVEGWEASF